MFDPAKLRELYAASKPWLPLRHAGDGIAMRDKPGFLLVKIRDCEELTEYLTQIGNAGEAMLERITELERELALTRGAMNADDERLRVAAERVGVVMGCD